MRRNSVWLLGSARLGLSYQPIDVAYFGEKSERILSGLASMDQAILNPKVLALIFSLKMLSSHKIAIKMNNNENP